MAFLDSLVKGTTELNDEVIANNMITSSRGLANAYLKGTLMSTTPELKALYSSSLSQVVSGQGSLAELAVNKGWEKPYDTPTQQLTDAYNKCDELLNQQ